MSMDGGWEYIATIKGARGDRGLQGIPGLDAVATDEGVAAYVSADESATAQAVKDRIREIVGIDPDLYAYNLTESSMQVFRSQLRGNAAARISVHGSSTPYGHWSGGRYLYSSWPGRVAQKIAARYGQVGPGMMIPWNALVPPALGQDYQPNYYMAGTVEARPLGIYGTGAIRVTKTGTSSWIGVRDVFCDTFRVVIAGTTSGSAEALVDGVLLGTFPTSPATTGTTFPAQPNYATDLVNGGGQVVVHIPAGLLGYHSLQIRPAGADGQTMTVLSIEPWVTTKPGVVVNNLALSGITSTAMSSSGSDTTNGYSGMSMSLDAPRAHLQVVQIGTNDYQVHNAVATFKAQVRSFIQRAKSSTSVANGGVTIPSSVLLVGGQPVNTATIPADLITVPPFSAYQAALYELADEENVALLDLNLLFESFAVGNAKGWYADDLHPSPLGHEMIARAVDRAIMAGV